MRKYFIIATLFAVIVIDYMVAQDQNICRLSPDGIYVLLSSAGASPKKPYNGITGYVVSRAEGASDVFQEIGRANSPSNLDEFKKQAGEELANQIKELYKLNSDRELWNFIREHPSLQDYGFLVLNPKLGVALGAYYLDESVKNAPTGVRYRYQVQYLQQGGETMTPVLSEIITGVKTPSRSPEIAQIVESDSLIALKWKSVIKGNEEVMFADVYRQNSGKGNFEKHPVMILVNRDQDSIYFYWQEKVEPQAFYKYVIVPADLFGNPGAASDTVNVLSVNFNTTPLLQDVVAKDTTGGIIISWMKLPEEDYWAGIMVERSRDARGNFIVLDTISWRADQYIDRRSLPNTAYYYRLKAVTIRQDQTPPSVVVSGDWKNVILAPLPPAELRAQNEGSNVRLDWQPNSEPDLFGYYVYRGKSMENMEVISPHLKETFYLDTAKTLDGRNEYLYAVKAVNLSDMVSDFSNTISVRPLQFTPPPAPAGVSGYHEGVRIRLNWTDVSEMEESIVGYQVYRRAITIDNEKLPQNFDGLPASAAAERFGFRLIANSPSNYYDDLDFESGNSYQYAVSSIDAAGIQSGLSSVANVAGLSSLPDAPLSISVRTVSAGVIIEWGAVRQNSVVGYAVYRRTQNESEPVKIAEISADQTVYTDTKSTAGLLHLYSVSVMTGAGESKRSIEKGIR